jgi:hypothetical protein
MYMTEQCVLLVHLWWITGLFKQHQVALKIFCNAAPSKSGIQKMGWKLWTKGTQYTQHNSGGPAMTVNTIQVIQQQLLQNHCQLSQQTDMSYSLCKSDKERKV